jgi:hypothetical protein
MEGRPLDDTEFGQMESLGETKYITGGAAAVTADGDDVEVVDAAPAEDDAVDQDKSVSVEVTFDVFATNYFQKIQNEIKKASPVMDTKGKKAGRAAAGAHKGKLVHVPRHPLSHVLCPQISSMC